MSHVTTCVSVLIKGGSRQQTGSRRRVCVCSRSPPSSLSPGKVKCLQRKRKARNTACFQERGRGEEEERQEEGTFSSWSPPANHGSSLISLYLLFLIQPAAANNIVQARCCGLITFTTFTSSTDLQPKEVLKSCRFWFSGAAEWSSRTEQNWLMFIETGANGCKSIQIKILSALAKKPKRKALLQRR